MKSLINKGWFQLVIVAGLISLFWAIWQLIFGAVPSVMIKGVELTRWLDVPSMMILLILLKKFWKKCRNKRIFTDLVEIGLFLGILSAIIFWHIDISKGTWWTLVTIMFLMVFTQIPGLTYKKNDREEMVWYYTSFIIPFGLAFGLVFTLIGWIIFVYTFKVQAKIFLAIKWRLLRHQNQRS